MKKFFILITIAILLLNNASSTLANSTEEIVSCKNKNQGDLCGGGVVMFGWKYSNGLAPGEVVLMELKDRTKCSSVDRYKGCVNWLEAQKICPAVDDKWIIQTDYKKETGWYLPDQSNIGDMFEVDWSNEYPIGKGEYDKYGLCRKNFRKCKSNEDYNGSPYQYWSGSEYFFDGSRYGKFGWAYYGQNGDFREQDPSTDVQRGDVRASVRCIKKIKYKSQGLWWGY